MGFGSWNRKKLFRILDLESWISNPGVKKAPDPGFGSATLVFLSSPKSLTKYINVNESRETRKLYFKLAKVTNVSYKKIIKAF